MRPSTKLLLGVFLVGCAGGALMHESVMAPARAESAPPPGTARYEYRVATVRPESPDTEQVTVLNQMGQQGFHLVGTAMGPYGMVRYISERPLAQGAIPQAPAKQPGDAGTP
jgi:hypothetical protein